MEARAIAMESCDVLVECGFIKPLATIKISDVPQLLKCASLHSTVLRIKSELDQFIGGLNTAGVLSAIRDHPELFSSLFVFEGHSLTAGEVAVLLCHVRFMYAALKTDLLLDLFKTKQFSERGCSQLQREQSTYVFFRDLLYEVEGECNVCFCTKIPCTVPCHLGGELDITLKDVLEIIPPLGFDDATLSFSDTNPYPISSTCGQPSTVTEDFKENFMFAVCNHGGFGVY